MPVTAKLSKAFYDQFGDKIVTELVDWFNLVDATYRADLRELNELNFARFDAKLEQRMAQLEAKLSAELVTGLRSLESTLHRDMLEQTRFMIGTMIALWSALLIPIIGLWVR